ncbi:MAG TPA: Pvc16 family protein [Pyrinomonadaceae bacterium]|nr:Pvc16 family protein [Pyrinomonadaceae bacterium]
MRVILSTQEVKQEFPQLGEAHIEFARPVIDYAPKAPQTICLFLYDIRENRELRSNELSRVMGGNGQSTIAPPPLRLDCSYLVTAWPIQANPSGTDVDQETGQDPFLLEHLLLSEVLQVLARYPTIPADFLQGKLANPPQDFPPPMITARAEGLNNISEFWTAIGSTLRPSLSVKATVSVQVSPSEVEAKPVLERILNEDNPARLDISGLVKDNTGTPVAGARIMIQELNLSTTSDEKGLYGFSQIPIGKYNLRANWKTEKGVKSKMVEIDVPAPAGAYDVELIG